MKQLLLTLAIALALVAVVPAAPPIEADPNKDYPINPQAGSWVIVATTYKGPDGADLAHQLVLHLRGKHNMAAYVWNFADKQRADMKAEEERWKQQNPQLPFKRWHIEDQNGVLIGGFEDMESARDYMTKVVKKLPLPPLKLAGGKSPFDTAIFLVPDGPNGAMKPKSQPISPFAGSFVSRNPALGLTGKKPPDPFLKELNALEDYSLLRCQAPYTLAVKAFGGSTMYVSQKKTEDTSTVGGFLDKLFGSDKQHGDALNAAAYQAHELARELNDLKFEAYVLHTRTSSIVAIGGFKGPDDPALQRMVERIAAMNRFTPNNFHQLGLYPIPYEIPRP